MKEFTISVLGTSYTVCECSADEDATFEDDECDGYTDWTIKKIAVRRELSGTLKDMDEYVRKVKRHEILHAFVEESGLAECSFVPDKGWARNEEMVDWFARQGPKIYEAWRAADAL